MHAFNGPLSGTIRVSRYQKGKTDLDFTEARDSEWQWHQLGHMQVCNSLQTDNHANTPSLSFFKVPDALPAAQPTVSKHNSKYITSPKTSVYSEMRESTYHMGQSATANTRVFTEPYKNTATTVHF